MTEHAIDAEPTFEPWYHHVALTIPRDAISAEARRLRWFSRECRASRIANNIALMPARSMFAWPAETREAI